MPNSDIVQRRTSLLFPGDGLMPISTAVIIAFLVLLAAAMTVLCVSLTLNGSWRAVRRTLRWRKKIRLEPDAFIASLRLYQPELMIIHSVNNDEIQSWTIAYRMFFDTEINRLPTRFITTFSAMVIPDSGTRIVMMRDLVAKRASPTRDALSDTVRALVRLIDNSRLRGYEGPATAFNDNYYYSDVAEPAVVSSTDGNVTTTPTSEDLRTKDVIQILSG